MPSRTCGDAEQDAREPVQHHPVAIRVSAQALMQGVEGLGLCWFARQRARPQLLHWRPVLVGVCKQNWDPLRRRRAVGAGFVLVLHRRLAHREGKRRERLRHERGGVLFLRPVQQRSKHL